LLLPVSAPFHCALMTPAAAEMADALDNVDIEEPKVPLVANVLAAGVTNPTLIRSLLVDQVSGRVRWKTSVEWMVEQGVTEFWEVGAGKALCGMIRRIAPEATSRAVGDAAGVKEAVESRPA